MRLMYSEHDDALRVLEKGFINGYSYQEVLVLAKFYRHVYGYGDARLRTALKTFCEDHDSFFRYIPRRNSIRNVIKKSQKEMKNTLGLFSITRNEIDAIKSIKYFKYQLILLAMTVIAKVNKRDMIWKNEWKYIRALTSQRFTNRIIKDCITTAYNQGLIGEPNSDLHTLMYVNDGVPVFTFHNDNDLFKLADTYKSYCGGELIYCKNCGSEFIKDSNRHRYCEKCRTEKNREIKRNWWTKNQTRQLDAQINI